LYGGDSDFQEELFSNIDSLVDEVMEVSKINFIYHEYFSFCNH
jgi:hypothetical protein